MENQRKTGKSTLTISKSQLVENFYQRLLDSYGYSKNQVAKNVSIFSHSVADIAIWRSEEEKIQGRTPNIYVLVACRTEHIRIETGCTEQYDFLCGSQSKRNKGILH